MGDSWVTWRTKVVSELDRVRGLGIENFGQAWRMVIAAHPPRQMEQGPVAPSFDDEVSVLEFFRVACEDAWLGRRAELEDLPGALEGGLIRNWPTVGRGISLR